MQKTVGATSPTKGEHLDNNTIPAVCGSLRNNSSEIKCQTLSNQFSFALMRPTQPAILSIHIPHARADLFSMAVIIIKGSVMTADNPHKLGHPRWTGSPSVVKASLKPKIHTDVQGGQNHKLLGEPCDRFWCTLGLNFLLAYGNFSTNAQLLSTEPPY